MMMRVTPLCRSSFGLAKSAICCLIAGILTTGCTTLPKEPPEKVETFGLKPTTAGVLAEVTSAIESQHGAEASGFLLLDSNEDALRWRLALADSAEKTLDAQYFIWHGDASGLLLLNRVLDAAERGVRVRLLIDDLMMGGGDRTVAALCRHANVEIRIFNPWNVRSGGGAAGRGVEFATHMKRLNHRMHNKLFVADNQIGIVGGRNIGDEYFGLSSHFNFLDLDLLAAGPVVAEVTSTFDYYWNSDWTYPGEALKTDLPPDALDRARSEIRNDLAKEADVLDAFPMGRENWESDLAPLPQEMHVGVGHVAVDNLPAGADLPPVQVFETLSEFAEGVEQEIFVASAYFIPDNESIDWVARATERGVRVRVLTNSLASNDESVSNSGYKKVRRPVLEAGGELFELREDPAQKSKVDTSPATSEFVAFHTKAMVVDRRKVFVGSLNLDPRSIYLNTEMGLLIEQPGLGEELARIFEQLAEPENSWRVFIDGGELRWESSEGVVSKQPARGGWQRIQDSFYSLLPIKSQL
jgi:putative cardiolipin synthase